MVMKLQFSIYFRHNYEQVFRYLPSATMIFLDNSSKVNLSYTHFHRSWKWGIRVSPRASVCASVHPSEDRIVSTLCLEQYYTRWIHFIVINLIKQLKGCVASCFGIRCESIVGNHGALWVFSEHRRSSCSSWYLLMWCYHLMAFREE